LPACGRSATIPLEYATLQTYAQILASFASHMACGEPLHGIVGHSMGGLLALLLAQKHPEIARRVSICGAPVAGVRYLRPLTERQGFVTSCLQMVASIPIVGRLLGDADACVAGALLKEVCGCRLIEQCTLLPANLLVTRGEHDPYVSQTVARQCAEASGGTFYEFQGAFHTPILEQREEFHRVVGGFLDG